MDCRVKPGNDEIGHMEPNMRRNPHGSSSRSCSLAPLLAGCLERGQPTMVDSSGDDDAFCARSHAAGSPDYVNCRKDRDVQRANANSRADKRQRNLGEYMLNNPTRP